MGLDTYRPALDNGITSSYAHLRQYVVSRRRPQGRAAQWWAVHPGRVAGDAHFGGP
ncbi:hypothetical protein [Streptomyces yangpuensis]|uniref:hypothetical protein n=1 Tax=Streptomyces yangpuensis TaxID=1648182 RepID=UPI003817F342